MTDPMIPATRLWKKTSAKGNTYLTGRMGSLRVLIFENRDAGKDGEPSHIMYFQDGSDGKRPAQRSQQREAPPDDGAPWPEPD